MEFNPLLILQDDSISDQARFYLNENWRRLQDVLKAHDGPILASPDGALWRITVDNAGVLSAVAL